MAGFVPSPEKEKMQDLLWIPIIRDFFKKNSIGEKPLRVICLPGRECRFLRKLLERGYTTLEDVTCIEREPVEALLIRGRLASYSRTGRATIHIVTESIYDYFVSGDQAIERKYQIVDMDPYGRIEDPKSDLLNSIHASIQIQQRANVDEWVLLLTTEVASIRNGVSANLAAAEKVMLDAYGNDVLKYFDAALISDQSGPARLLRYAACVANCIIEMAYPYYETRLARAPMFYRGSDIYGRPSLRALMGGFPFTFKRTSHPVAALGAVARAKMLAPLLEAATKRALGAKAVVADNLGVAAVTPDLNALRFE